MRLIDADALDAAFTDLRFNADGTLAHWGDRPDWCLHGREVEKLIHDAPTVGGWISVEDRLPEPPAQCLVYSDKARRPRGMETATYTNLGWMTAAYFPEITHWMPLPEPPEDT